MKATKSFRIIDEGLSTIQLSEMELNTLKGGCFIDICVVKGCGVEGCVGNIGYASTEELTPLLQDSSVVYDLKEQIPHFQLENPILK